MGLNILINNGLVYPANYADIESINIESGFQSDNWTPKEIPFYYDFLYLENGEVVENTIDKKYNNQVMDALKHGRSSSGEIIGSNVFKSYSKDNKQLVIRYKISVIPTSERLYELLENFETLYICLMLISWFSGFTMLVIHSSKILKREIHKISSANENINKMDLDYQRDSSRYKEIDGVLNSIDILAKNLKNSLNKQWNMQMKQKEMIESITHDIRTPITLIKGNLELLKEEHPQLSFERFSDISNGILRLEKYIEKLKHFSYVTEGKKDSVSNEVISYWTEVISSICRANARNLSIIKNECSDMSLDKEAIAVALQNIVNNSIENSKQGSVIHIEFSDTSKDFSIIIRDEGSGFDEGLLPKLTDKFISGKVKDKNYKHGLGLSIVKKIVDANNGKLYLKNRSESNTGAEVKMVFSKTYWTESENY